MRPPTKCPNCESNQFGYVKPPEQEAFIISRANEETERVLGTHMPVEVYGCADCEHVMFFSTGLSRKQ